MQGKDVSKYDAWKLILLSDLFPKVKTSFNETVHPYTLYLYYAMVMENSYSLNI